MANEAVLIFETAPAIPFTILSTQSVERGALMRLTDPMTTSGATAAAEMCAGIAATEKIANDGKTKISVYDDGIFRLYASGAINVGQAIGIADGQAGFPNYVKQAGVTASGAAILGYALETAAAGETFLARVKVGCGGNQIS